MRILLVEDDELLGNGIRSGLAQYQYVVDWAKNGLSAWSAIQTEHFDIIILDLNLPRMSGEEVLKNMRSKNIKIPVIVLTSRDEISTRIRNLDEGADDYIVKPFDLGELCARIRAVHRRLTIAQATTEINVGGISLDPKTRIVKNGEEIIELSRREFVLLQLLLENAGKVITRQQATQSLYGWGYDIDSNALEVHVHNLRKKFGKDKIRTIRGVGYCFQN